MAILRREDHIKTVVSALTYLKVTVQNLNGARLFDAAKVSEEFSKDFLNIAFGYSLSNLNTINADYPAIDLGDVGGRICVQVTSTSDRDKLSSTIEKFCAHKLNEKFDTLKFVIIGDRKNSYSNLKDYGGVSFDPELDIIDIAYLCKHCALLPSSQLARLSDLCGSEIQMQEPRRRASPDLHVFLRPSLQRDSTTELKVRLPEPRSLMDIEACMDQQKRLHPIFTKNQMELRRSPSNNGLNIPLPPEIDPILGSEYNTQLERYFEEYRRYLHLLNRHIELGHRLIRFYLTIENKGSCPAEDIRVFLSAPNVWEEFGDARASDCIALIGPKLPDMPVKPKKGERFDSQIELLKMIGAKQAKQKPLAKAVGGRLKIESTRITSSLDRLNQHLGRCLGEVYCVLKSHHPSTIPMDVIITASNIPERVQQSLKLIVEKPK